MTNASKKAPRTGRSRRDLMEAEILEGAAKVFEKKGIGSSTLQDVAEHLHIGRPSLYHYFPSKGDLVNRLVTDLLASTELALERAATLNARSSNANSHLRHVLIALLEPIAEFPSRFRIMLLPEATPDAASARRRAETHRRMAALVRSAIEEGITSGEFRNVDPQIATFVALGAINWVAWWYRPSSGISTEDLAQCMVDLIIGGIALPEGEAGAISSLYEKISTDVLRLGTMIDGLADRA